MCEADSAHSFAVGEHARTYAVDLARPIVADHALNQCAELFDPFRYNVFALFDAIGIARAIEGTGRQDFAGQVRLTGGVFLGAAAGVFLHAHVAVPLGELFVRGIGGVGGRSRSRPRTRAATAGGFAPAG